MEIKAIHGLPKLIFIKASDGQSPPHRCSGRRGLLSILCRLMADVMLVTFLQYYIPWFWKSIKVTLRPDWGSSLNCAWSCTKFRERGANCFVEVCHFNFDHSFQGVATACKASSLFLSQLPS